MKFRADLRPNNGKATILLFKTDDFVKFNQILSKINIFSARVFFSSFYQFFIRNEIFWSLIICIKVYRGATTSSELGVQFLGLGDYCPSREKN